MLVRNKKINWLFKFGAFYTQAKLHVVKSSDKKSVMQFQQLSATSLFV